MEKKLQEKASTNESTIDTPKGFIISMLAGDTGRSGDVLSIAKVTGECGEPKDIVHLGETERNVFRYTYGIVFRC